MSPEDNQIKTQVRHFYDRVGWQQVAGGQYQNARYEDLRPVSYEYIHRCHLRVNRYLSANTNCASRGKYLLDAGSGPIQYPEYLSYSEGYQYRVCLDISIVALEEAQTRIREHGLFVVADVANLPFKSEAFDGVVSLHTLHHLPVEDQKKAYFDLFRTLKTGSSMVVINGWNVSPLMDRLQPIVKLMEMAASWFAKRRIRLEGPPEEKTSQQKTTTEKIDTSCTSREQTLTCASKPTGTFIQKRDAASLKLELASLNPQIRVWRSLSVRFMRAVIKEKLGGRFWLKLVYWLEERFPEYFGEQGQYPLVVIRK